jgi:hypothetical protein
MKKDSFQDCLLAIYVGSRSARLTNLVDQNREREEEETRETTTERERDHGALREAYA